jgi:hypothetical protein
VSEVISGWSEYARWNEALATVLFSPEQAALPVYIDVDASVLGRAAQVVGAEPESAEKTLIDAVRGTLGLAGDDIALQEHTARYLAWRRRFSRANADRRKGAAVELPPPPVIALLCVLVIAAERMGADSSQAAHAYYPRLGEVLELAPAELTKLRNRFPQTELYWRGLNEYLEAHEGELGLPTAYALSFRYVGIPQSQALVRAADRVKLPDFFGRYGLSPGSEIIAVDLERLLDSWITTNPCPVTHNLRQLWNRGKARERVAGVVAVELSLWDGTFREGTESSTRSRGEIQLTALIRQQFGGRRLELSFAARLPRQVEASELVIKSAEGEPRIGVVSAAGARLRPIPGSQLDPNSLVGAILDFEEPVSGQVVSRRPRRVVPLRRDELLGNLVETDRVQLADDVVILIKDDPNLLNKALELVSSHGHHGVIYRAVETGNDAALQGLPDGWVLVDDVQMYAVPQNVPHMDLHVLVPLTTAQLNFSAGLKLPGRIKKWSSLEPPEIRAAVAEAEKMAISLFEFAEGEPRQIERWSEASCAMVVSLRELALADGDYEVELEANGDVVSRQTLRLRSGDSPDVVTWETCTRLNYELDKGAIGALTARSTDPAAQLFVDGLQTLGEHAAPAVSVPVPEGIAWKKDKDRGVRERPLVVLGTPDPKSCVITGAHRIQLPTWHGGKVKGHLTGVCTMCGLTKILPARPRWKKQGTSAGRPPNIQIAELPEHHDLGVPLNSCLDALVHVGGGNIGAFERVAAQAEAGALFADQFLRSLEALGHIDVRRDRHLQPVEWEANPAYLAETIGNGFVLAGVWSDAARRALRGRLEGSGGRLVEHRSGELAGWFARDVDADSLEQIVESLGLSAGVIADAARRMLAVLPPLSAVQDELPLIPIPEYSKSAIFNLQTASWDRTPGVGVPGAYRLEQSFRSVSIFLDAEGAAAAERRARLGSVQLVKHLAARRVGRPLLGYYAEKSLLLTPLGADLPGLYGRVATLCSGLPALRSSNTASVVYQDVPRDIADTLSTLLAT